MYQANTYPGIDPSVLENGGVSMVRDNKRCPAVFKYFTKEIKEEGKPPVFKDEEHIQFMLPGGNTTGRKATEQDRLEYAPEYAAFKRGTEQSPVGYCLTRVTWLSPAQIKTYQALNIPTLEALTNAPDTVIQQIMGGLNHREQAKAVLASMSGQQPMVNLVAKNEEQENQIKLLQEQIKELCARLDEVGESKKAKQEKVKTA